MQLQNTKSPFSLEIQLKLQLVGHGKQRFHFLPISQDKLSAQAILNQNI